MNSIAITPIKIDNLTSMTEIYSAKNKTAVSVTAIDTDGTHIELPAACCAMGHLLSIEIEVVMGSEKLRLNCETKIILLEQDSDSISIYGEWRQARDFPNKELATIKSWLENQQDSVAARFNTYKGLDDG